MWFRLVRRGNVFYQIKGFVMNQMVVRALLLLGVLFCGLSACKNEVEEFPMDLGYAYFPLESGQYFDYQVDSIIYNDFDRVVDTNRFQLREVIGDSARDGENNLYYRVNRYTRATSGDSWRFKNTWVALVTDFQAQRVESNQRFIKLSFPPRVNEEWDGTVFLNVDTTIAIPGGNIDIYKDWDKFQYTRVDEALIINTTSYDSVLQVLLVDKENNIERRYGVEYYARGLGLVYKELRILDTQCEAYGGIVNCLNVPWEEKAEKGFILRQELIDSGFL